MRRKWLLVACTLGALVCLPPGANAQGQDKKINVEGCVVRADAGRYVLANVRIVAASPGVNASPDQTFTLAQVDPERLESLAGGRAQVSARVAGTGQAPQLDVISIVAAVGTCHTNDSKPAP